MNDHLRTARRALLFSGLGITGALIALAVVVLYGPALSGAPFTEIVAEIPTRTPAPPVTAQPTSTPAPTATQEPTSTPMPTTTPTSTALIPPIRIPTLSIIEITPLGGWATPTSMGPPPPPGIPPTIEGTPGATTTPTEVGGFGGGGGSGDGGGPGDTETPAPTILIPVTGGDGAPEELYATGTAAAFDAQATNDQAADASAPIQPPQVAMVAHEFTVYDEAGAELGSGQVRVYAPAQVKLGEIAEIRVEIVANAVISEGYATMNPSLSPTPSIGTPRPTPSPMALVESQFVIVREYMGAGLSGPDIGNFRVDPVPPNGLRRLQAGAVNWWKWTIEPVGEQAVGTNHLSITIYLPRTRSDGTSFNEETNTIPLQIEVPGAKRGGGSQGLVIAIVGALVAVGGAGGAFYGAFQFARQMRHKQALPPPVVTEGKPGAEDEIEVKVSGDVEGQVTIAGDDVITYQTVIQKMPVSLVIGLIIGLAALVIGLGVIVTVMSGGL